MNSGDPGFPVAYQPYPNALPAQRPRTADIVATSMLLMIYLLGYAATVFFSMFWVMATDACSSETCNYNVLTYAYVANDLVGGVVALAITVAAVILMIRKRIAFWLPLIGIGTQVGLLAVSVVLLGNITY